MVHESTEDLLKAYRDLYIQRKESIGNKDRSRLTHELNELERRIRSAVKAQPIPEPLGLDKLQKIADQITALGLGIIAARLTNQHFRHPTSIPFQNMDHVRDYLGVHLEAENLAQIPELNPKKKILGLF